jgi:hypothetical protein
MHETDRLLSELNGNGFLALDDRLDQIHAHSNCVLFYTAAPAPSDAGVEERGRIVL